jgi:HSP20 family protein
MFGLTPYNPNSLKRRRSDLVNFNNLFEDFFRDSLIPLSDLKNDTFKVDVKETDEEYKIDAEMPGFKKEEIKIQCDDEMITISAERKEEKKEEKENYIHQERFSSSVSRSLYLPNIEHEGIKAKLNDGVLKVTVPKKGETKAKKQITVD